MVVSNRFVPIEIIPAVAHVLHRYGRGTNLDAAELQTLEEYWGEIDRAVKRLHELLVDGEAASVVQAIAKTLPTWPALGVAESEESLLSLLTLQFERIRQKRISWTLADGSTYPTPTRDGMYLLIDWARHG